MAHESLEVNSLATNSFAIGQSQEDDESDLDHIEPRQASLFLLDATPPMFETDQNTGECPFLKSLLTYMKSMQMMCAFNRDDWISLMFFGTNEWDREPEIKNVLTVQKFQRNSIDMLKEIKDKLENHRDSFRQLSSDSTYPLHDALWHASQAFAAVKTVVIARKVILLTCEDNPFPKDENERHRIRARVLTFKNLGVDLRVIGLKDNFDQDAFYKDLEVISSGIDIQSYKKLKLDDLEEEIQFPSRTISSILWKIGPGVNIPVSIYTVSTPTKYPETAYINKKTNQPLKSFLVYEKKSEYDMDDDFENDEGEFDSKVVAAGGIAKFQKHGDMEIVFDMKELSMMFDQFTKGIETICFKPGVCDPMYHVESPKFLTYKDTASEKEKEFFAGLLTKCVEKGLMAVCRITYRIHNAPNMFYFYPSSKKGGFYIYKMPYEDHVRNLDETLKDHYFDDKNHYPTDDKAISVFEKIIKKTRIKFDTSLFKNPKLGTQIANIEALALDLEQRILPPDSTLPSEKIKERVAVVMPEYNAVFGEDEPELPAKRVKLIDEREMRLLMQTNSVESCTVSQLKEFLKQKNVWVAGSRKADLVAKVYHFLRNN